MSKKARAVLKKQKKSIGLGIRGFKEKEKQHIKNVLKLSKREGTEHQIVLKRESGSIAIPIRKGISVKIERLSKSALTRSQLEKDYYKQRVREAKKAKKIMKRLGLKIPKKTYFLSDLTLSERVLITQGLLRRKIREREKELSTSPGGGKVQIWVKKRGKKIVSRPMLIALGTPKQKRAKSEVYFVTFHEIIESNFLDSVAKYLIEKSNKKSNLEMKNILASYLDKSHSAANSIALKMIEKKVPKEEIGWLKCFKNEPEARTSSQVDEYINRYGIKATIDKIKKDPMYFC